MELLLVVAIIAIIAALWLGASSLGLFRAKKLSPYIAEGQTNIVNSMDREDNRQ